MEEVELSSMSAAKSEARKCAICEEVVSEAEETFLKHVNEAHNITLSEYDAWHKTNMYLLEGEDKSTMNGGGECTTVRSGQPEHSRSDDAQDKVDSGVEDGGSDQELATLLTNQPNWADHGRDDGGDVEGDSVPPKAQQGEPTARPKKRSRKVHAAKRARGAPKGRPRLPETKWGLGCTYRCQSCNAEKDDWTGVGAILES